MWFHSYSDPTLSSEAILWFSGFEYYLILFTLEKVVLTSLEFHVLCEIRIITKKIIINECIKFALSNVWASMWMHLIWHLSGHRCSTDQRCQLRNFNHSILLKARCGYNSIFHQTCHLLNWEEYKNTKGYETFSVDSPGSATWNFFGSSMVLPWPPCPHVQTSGSLCLCPKTSAGALRLTISCHPLLTQSSQSLPQTKLRSLSCFSYPIVIFSL